MRRGQLSRSTLVTTKEGRGICEMKYFCRLHDKLQIRLVGASSSRRKICLRQIPFARGIALNLPFLGQSDEACYIASVGGKAF